MLHRMKTPTVVALTSFMLAGCASSDGDERLELVAERLDHFQQEVAGDGVLVPPLLVQGSAEVPDFDFDLDEGYVLTIYCIGDATLEVRIDGEPSDIGTFECESGMTTMARNAPDITPAESDIAVSTDNEDSYWLAAVTRSTEQYRDEA